MGAPNKIYIPQHNIEAGTIQELCELIVEGSVEYIRKDLLLEWLEERINDGDEEGLMTNQIANFAYKDVIDKINSL